MLCCVKCGAVKACRKHKIKILLILNPYVAVDYSSSGAFGMSSMSSTSIVLLMHEFPYQLNYQSVLESICVLFDTDRIMLCNLWSYTYTVQYIL